MKAFLKTLPQTIVGLVFLGVITIFGYVGTLSSSSTYQAFLALLTLVGATGIWILASNWENINASPNLIVGLASMIALVILGLHHVFASDQISYTLMLVLMGSAVGVGGPAITTVMQKKQQPPAPTPVAHPSTVDSSVTITRRAGLRGRLPSRRLGLPYVHSYVGSPFPAPAYPIDVTGGITAWGMLGNGPDPTLTVNGGQPVGDCTFAGREHLKMAKAAAGHETETWETSDALVTEYLAYDNGQDQGANIADLLLAWYKSGKILAFGVVDHTDKAACDAAMAAFHGLYCGVNLTDDADELFGEGKPWTTANGEQPNPSEGHCIVKVKADGSLDGWVTWGAIQPSTVDWTAACLDEAYVIITQEDADAVGLDIAALRADIDALSGTGGTPQPVPSIPPPPPTGVAEWFRDFLDWLETL